jgi:hypothetical protein
MFLEPPRAEIGRSHRLADASLAAISFRVTGGRPPFRVAAVATDSVSKTAHTLATIVTGSDMQRRRSLHVQLSSDAAAHQRISLTVGVVDSCGGTFRETFAVSIPGARR